MKWFTAEYRKFQVALTALVPLLGKVLADGNVSAQEIGLLATTAAVAFGVKAVANK